jgi:uncharacterized repeat protein (TIGR01451 family)
MRPSPQTETASAPVATRTNKSIDTQAPFVPGEILVRFRADANAKKIAAASTMTLSAAGNDIQARLERFDEAELVAGLRLARVAPEETVPAIEAFRARPDVLYAEPNYRRYRTEAPNDARYTELWGLHNTGQSGGLAGTDIKAERAWNVTKGSRDFVVAVIDEGIDVSHQDLAENIWRNPAEIPGNGRDDDSNGFVDDYHGYDFFHGDASVYDGPGTNPDGSVVDLHGTHVAGTIGAVGNNSTGVVGVNWQTSLMSLKFLGPDGGSSADALRAYSYARMMRERWQNTGGAQGANIRVTNNSYGGGGFSQAEVDGIRALYEAGILFVAAAGNEAEDSDIMPGFPASYDLPNVISVAALDRSNNLSDFSNRGSRTVHLAAPGTSILSTTPGNTYNFLSGTSMASPHVAGAAALVLAAYPGLDVTRLRAALLFGGAPQAFLDPLTTTGRRLSAAGALENAALNDATPPAPLSDLHIAAQTGRFITLQWTAPGDDGGNIGTAALYEIRFTDQTTGARFLLAVQRPGPAGTPRQSANVRVPYRHPAGAFSVRAIDKAGNASESSVNVSVAEADVNPYLVATESPLPLSTGGDRMNLNADDRISIVSLPFNFPYYDQVFSNVNISSNGALYFSTNTPRNDAFNLRQALDGRRMIAGLWDDLDLRTCLRADADVYIVRPPENDRIIFRWQGVRFTTSACPATPAGGNFVNFEIELRRDGTIQMRYGENTRISPVVGIGGGDPEGYFISSHSTERKAAPINLTNAPAITYTLRQSPVVADLQLTGTTTPSVIHTGENLTYNLRVTNHGPGRAAGVELTHTLTPQVTLVSCNSMKGACSAPSNGKVSLILGQLEPAESANIIIAVKVIASSSGLTFINSTTTILGATYDPDPTNNTYRGSAQIVVPAPPPLPTGTLSLPTFSPDGSTYATTQNVTVRNATADATIVNVAAGSRHTIAQSSEGRVYGWGGASQGQLAFDAFPPGHLGPIPFVSVARPIDGLAGTTALAAGDAHTLALRSDGIVLGWGFNIFGQVGTGSQSDYVFTPAPVVGLTGAAAIAAGGHRSLALRSDGTVWQWGAGANPGGLFLGGPPVPVSGLANITAIAAGYNHSMAVRNDGTVLTWGNNFNGQLGTGGTDNQAIPREVSGLNNVTIVAGRLWSQPGPEKGWHRVGLGDRRRDERFICSDAYAGEQLEQRRRHRRWL